MHTGWDKPLLIRRNAGEPAWAGCRHNGRKAAPFWTLLPSFLFLAIIFSIHSNGEAIAQQRAAWRDNRAVDFRQVQGTMTGAGVSNVLAGIGGAVPNIINPGTISFTQITGIAARRLGYCIDFIIIVAAFLPKVSGLIPSIPAPVMTGYLMLVSGTLLVDGARLVIQNEPNRQKVTAAGICFWVGASFHFNLFFLPDFGPVWDTQFKSAITTDGLAAVLMILYLEFISGGNEANLEDLIRQLQQYDTQEPLE